MAMCNICGKVFSTQSSHNRHVREVHKEEGDNKTFIQTSWSNRCIELACNNAFSTKQDLIEHLGRVHLMKFETVIYNMENLNEFENWKSGIELENNCLYVLKSRKSSTTGETIYYYCNRNKKSYNLECNKKQIKAQKSQGSNKMDIACTSNIKIIHENNKIHVEWHKTHYGHDVNLQHIPLHKLEKSNIASKLICGVTSQRILETTRDNIDENLKRIDLLTSKDIRNIKRNYGIDVQDGKRDSNDAISVSLWVEEQKSHQDNSVLFYKAQGVEDNGLKHSDFCLIIMNSFQKQMITKFPNIITIDSTHGLNGYDFEMTTVMVIDEYNHGFPVAEMFSNRKDVYIQNLFYTKIKEAVGIINSKVVMTDMDNTFYNAWCGVMCACEHLFCAWHVDRAWQKNLIKISNKEKCAEVYKLLKVLQHNTPEIDFPKCLNNAITFMCSEKETQLFGEYFKNNYFYNSRKWSYCYRKEFNINTNMHLEAMHKVIKYFYLERKTVKRLDKGLNAVLKYVRDKMVERVIRLTKGENVSKNKLNGESSTLPAAFKLINPQCLESKGNNLNEIHEAHDQLIITNNSSKSTQLKKINDNLNNLNNLNFEQLEESCLSEINKHLSIANKLAVCKLPENNFELKTYTLKRNIEPQLRFESTKKKRTKRSGHKKASEQETRNIQEDLLNLCNKRILVNSVTSLTDHNYVK